MIIADTSGLLAFLNRRETSHDEVSRLISDSSETLVVSPYVVAELDYLIASRAGVDAEREALAVLASGAYLLAQFGAEDLLTASTVIGRYRDQQVGVTDASLVVLAHRYGTRTILTLDHRHFDVLRPLSGGRFRILPSKGRGS